MNRPAADRRFERSCSCAYASPADQNAAPKDFEALAIPLVTHGNAHWPFGPLGMPLVSIGLSPNHGASATLGYFRVMRARLTVALLLRKQAGMDLSVYLR